MAYSTKNKIALFGVGLVAGVAIGVVFGVTIKSLFTHLDELSRNIMNINSKEQHIAQRLDSIEGKVTRNDKQIHTIAVSHHTLKKDTQQSSSYHTPDARVVKNSLKQTSAAEDTIRFVGDNTGADYSGDSSDVVVMTSRMIDTASIPIVNMDTTQPDTNKAVRMSDSEIDALNNLTPLSSPSSCLVEFWVSPLNLKGYKMGLNKIIVYGIYPNVAIKLVKLNDTYYLCTAHKAYIVAYTDELRPFDAVRNKNILKKIGL